MTADPRLLELGYEHVYSGKVRDLYRPAESPGFLLVVASNRVSAFDHVLEPEIPGKGAALTSLSAWWFGRVGGRNHVVGSHSVDALPDDLRERAMLVEQLEMIPVECVARGYLVGSGWLEYRSSQSVCGIPLPAGLQNGDRLPEPIYTPAFKAPLGQHDENIPFERTIELAGSERDAAELRDRTLELYAEAAAIAEERGLILADTKVEFGRASADGAITLGDELLTSDSSRYWDRTSYNLGGDGRLDSFDKQIVRDWLAQNWDAAERDSTEPPVLPDEIVTRTAARYRELIDRLTG